MIKLKKWDEFVKDVLACSSIYVETGLCRMLRNLYDVETEHLFITWVNFNGYCSSFPIGIGGYTKKPSKHPKDRTSRKEMQSYQLYKRTTTEQKFTGIQGALRHNLYVRFCHYLVNKFPEEYCHE